MVLEGVLLDERFHFFLCEPLRVFCALRLVFSLVHAVRLSGGAAGIEKGLNARRRGLAEKIFHLGSFYNTL